MNKKIIRLTESDLHRIVKESVNRILKESTFPTDDEYAQMGKYYVAADTNSEYFDDYNEAYRYAYNEAKKSYENDGYNMEDIHLMDNQKWQSIVIFDYKGIHDLESGTFQPW